MKSYYKHPVLKILAVILLLASLAWVYFSPMEYVAYIHFARFLFLFSLINVFYERVDLLENRIRHRRLKYLVFPIVNEVMYKHVNDVSTIHVFPGLMIFDVKSWNDDHMRFQYFFPWSVLKEELFGVL